MTSSYFYVHSKDNIIDESSTSDATLSDMEEIDCYQTKTIFNKTKISRMILGIMTWKRFPHYWPFVWCHQWHPVTSWFSIQSTSSAEASFDIVFVLSFGKIFSELSTRRWNEMPLKCVWHHRMIWDKQSTLKYCTWWRHQMLTGPLWGESTGHRWISLTKASDAELWHFLDPRLKKKNGWANKQDPRWFETPSRPLYRHCDKH